MEEPALSICLIADEITFCNSTVRRRILIPAINLVGSPHTRTLSIPPFSLSSSASKPPAFKPLRDPRCRAILDSFRTRKFKGEGKNRGREFSPDLSEKVVFGRSNVD